MGDGISAPTIIDLLQKAGLLGALITFSVLGAKRIICWGYQLDEQKALTAKAEKECDAWKTQAEERGAQLTQAFATIRELTEKLSQNQRRR